MRRAVRTRLEVRAKGEREIEQIDAEARRLLDPIERLRHLRAFLILRPRRFRCTGFRWRHPPLELAALAVAAALIGMAILVWILK